jgi:hypothetical protein
MQLPPEAEAAMRATPVAEVPQIPVPNILRWRGAQTM